MGCFSWKRFRGWGDSLLTEGYVVCPRWRGRVPAALLRGREVRGPCLEKLLVCEGCPEEVV